MMKYLALFIVLSMVLFTPVAVPEDELVKLRVPVRIFILTSKIVPEMNTNLTAQDMHTVLKDVNQAWEKAGIEFWPSTVTKRPARNEALYPRVFTKKSPLNNKEKNNIILKACGAKKLAVDGLDICVVGRMPTKSEGVTLRFSKKLPLIIWPEQEKNGFRANAATLAHELGHALGLRHNDRNKKYLLYSGSNIGGRRDLPTVRFSNNEIRTARINAEKFKPYWKALDAQVPDRDRMPPQL